MVLFSYPETFHDAISSVGETGGYIGTPLVVFHNPAFIPDIARFSASVSNPFGIEGFYAGNVAVSYRGMALGIESVNAGSYRRILIATGYSSSMKNYYFGGNIRVAEEEFGRSSDRSIDIDAGMGLRFGRMIIGVAHRGLIGPQEQSISSFLRYNVSNFSSVIELSLSGNHQLATKAAMKYHLTRLISLSIGRSIDPDIWGFGLTINGPIQVDYSFRQHRLLGGTHSLSVTMEIEK